jgi:mRNA interferase MazF
MRIGRKVSQWDVFRVDFDQTVGSEIAGDNRPAVVVSADTFNDSPIDVVTVVPLSKVRGKRRPVFSFEARIPAGEGGVVEESIALPQQVRTVAKLRLRNRMGRIKDRDLRTHVEDGLLALFGIEMEG